MNAQLHPLFEEILSNHFPESKPEPTGEVNRNKPIKRLAPRDEYLEYHEPAWECEYEGRDF